MLSASLVNEQRAKRALIRESAERKAALKQSKASLDHAASVVNTFYNQFANSWLANDQSLSQTQSQLLLEASKFYDGQLATAPRDALDLQQLVEHAFRSGSIQMKLNDFSTAAERFRLGIEEIGERNATLSESMRFKIAELTLYLAKCEFQQSNYSYAESQIERAIGILDQLLLVDPGVRPLMELRTRGVLLLSDIAIEQGHFQSAARNLEPLLESSSEFSGPDRVLRLKVSERLIAAWLGSGELDAAANLVSSSLRLCRSNLIDSQDAVPLRNLELALMQRQLGILLSEQDVSAAVAAAQENLQRQTMILTGDEALDVYSLRNFLDPTGFPERRWPRIRSQWVRTMTVLGVLRHQQGESLSAEMALGRAAVLAVINRHMYENSLRHRVDLANVYSQLAIMLEDRLPDESRDHATEASRVWLQAMRDFEDAGRYHSDMHTGTVGMSDFDRFLESFPDRDVRRESIKRQLAKAQQLGSKSVPMSRARAWQWSEIDDWSSALSFCEEIIKQRDGDDSYANYLASVCLVELGRMAEAEQAIRTAAEQPAIADPLLEKIRQRATSRHSPSERSTSGCRRRFGSREWPCYGSVNRLSSRRC